MSRRNKIIALIGAAIFYGALVADRLDQARRVYQAPDTAWAIWWHARSLFSGITTLGVVLFLLGTVCLVIATSEWWWRWAVDVRNAAFGSPATPAAPSDTIATCNPDRDAWFKDAVFYLVHDRWPMTNEPIAAPFRAQSGDYSKAETRGFLDEASRILRNLKQYAFDERYVIQGKPRNTMTVTGDVARHGVLDKIPREHWRDYQVGISALILDPEHVETSKKWPHARQWFLRRPQSWQAAHRRTKGVAPNRSSRHR